MFVSVLWSTPPGSTIVHTDDQKRHCDEKTKSGPDDIDDVDDHGVPMYSDELSVRSLWRASPAHDALTILRRMKVDRHCQK